MSGSGFTNDVMHAENVDFSGGFPVAPQVTADGQLLIGSTVAPNIRVGTLASGDGSITITNGAGTIDLSVAGGSAIETINGDSGSITGSTVTIYANNAANNSGASVSFVNSGTTSTLNVTDASGNTSIGENAGNIANLGGRNVVVGKLAGQNLAGTGVGANGAENVLLGYNAGNDMMTSSGNVAIGYNTLDSLTTGTVNTCLGYAAGAGLLNGQYCVLVGANAGINYNSNESGNIVLGSVAGTTAESNTIRIGAQGSSIAQQNRCFIAGIKSVTTSNSETVTIDTTTGQLGSTPNITPSNIKITTYNVVDSPATWTKDARTKVIEVFGWAGGGGGGSGRKGTTATSGGGAGGCAGGSFYYKGLSSFFGNTESVIIGVGSAGGNSQSTNATNGNPGTSGFDTSFGNILCKGGAFGAAGSTTSVAGGTGAQYITFVANGVNMTNAGAGTIAGTANSPSNTTANNFPLVATPGGGGGGADSTTQRAGGNGSNRVNLNLSVLLAAGLGGLESTGINGGNGNIPLTSGGTMSGGTGGGGGGGYSVGAGGATAGGNGGNGAIPGGGGGGGGGGLTGVANSGAGGSGADGQVVVIEYF